jgi:hypothetical protein
VGCASFGVSQILVGLFRVGVVGLKNALERAASSGCDDRETVVDRMLADLRRDNYVPDALLEAYRGALWREYLRYRGEDFSAHLSEVEVRICSRPGSARDRLVSMLTGALRKHELRPVVRFEEGPGLRVEIGEHTLLDGAVTREKLALAIRQTLSDW